MITLTDMQQNKSPIGIKEVVELIDSYEENIGKAPEDSVVQFMVNTMYGVEVEDLVIQLAKVKF